MDTIAEYTDGVFLVKKPRDVGHLHSKSKFGRMLPGNILKLDLLECLFLLGEEKLIVYHEKTRMDFQTLFTIAAKENPAFEILYLAFRDLRKRGYPVKQTCETKQIHFVIEHEKDNVAEEQAQRFVSVFSERDTVRIEEIRRLISTVAQRKGVLWFIIVDEEGDLTYYTVSAVEFRKEKKGHCFQKGSGFLMENRVVLFDRSFITPLVEQEFFGKPFGDGLQLSLVEALYLVEQGVLEVFAMETQKPIPKNRFVEIVQKRQPDIASRLLVFRDLKQRGLLVKTGFKFGTHFRVYTRNPDETHAEYLVHVVPQGFESIWAEISRAVRLAHSVNKEIFFACVGKETIEYIGFGRLRP